ncbi:D-isomer specific 2-hydroxyacid dehydrogenase NAD-binding domain-containing protein [Madurella fahalii]|uniref:D-isomer specific 2-hydroxyacid dehydrogenase NAD-binding domain-containing protein n=1 Tax=Madurella fahalii TaxID=1157608 RepID=A0ABQ0GGU0_9PEZI
MGSIMASELANSLSNDVLLMTVPSPPNETWIAELERKYPGFKVRWVLQETKLPAHPLPHDVYDGVTILCTVLPHPAELLPKLRYVQLMSAGADRWITHELYKRPGVMFCTGNGVHAPQIAEWVIGTWLMMSHCFLDYAAEQQKQKYSRMLHLDVCDSPGLRMGILGYGAIGRQCARLANALGMEIYAFTRSEKPTPESRRDDSYCVPGTGDADGLIPAKWFHGASREAVNNFLAQDLDLLVVSLPLTETTKYILGREQFGILSRKKTFVANIARGQHIDHDALLEALKEGKIRGAAIDVTDPEPLPDGHPLFTAPNLFITPHISWRTPRLFDRIQGFIEQNLERLSKGEPLINVVNREHHY